MKTEETKQNISLFQNQEIRKIWNDEQEKWYFSVIDVVAAISKSPTPKRYWSDLKGKLQLEGSQTYDKIVRFKMLASDNKMRETDIAGNARKNIEQVTGQSVISKNNFLSNKKPFKK